MRWKTVILFVITLPFLAGIWFLALRLEHEKPSITFAREPSFIGTDTPIEFAAEDTRTGLKRIEVAVTQGQTSREILSQDVPGGRLWRAAAEHRRPVQFVIDVKTLALNQGPATLTVTVIDNSWWAFGKGNVSRRELPVVVDTIPPRLDLLSTTHNVNVGGTGLVAYHLSEDPGTTGIEAGDRFFPGYPETAGGAGAFVAYFALPPEPVPGARIHLMARDRAGNVVRRAFPLHVREKKFPRDTIEISDEFLAAKMPEFAAADPGLGSEPLAAFLKVNREWRQRDHERLKQLCAMSRPQRLWSGSFLQMKNTQNMARYAEQRTYRHRGQVVDEQVHWGLDLASTAGAPVPAANAGMVVLAGDLGIYGQAVVLDHGQGLFSLYAHLSGIGVSAGQKVEKGGVLGSSGRTGMAGGDHLHYAMLVSGVFVSPLEWLDQHWIDDNVRSKLTLFTGAAAP